MSGRVENGPLRPLFIDGNTSLICESKIYKLTSIFCLQIRSLNILLRY